MKTEIYYCNDCGWKGLFDELEFDQMESCMGNVAIEVCPKCGSLDVQKKLEEKA